MDMLHEAIGERESEFTGLKGTLLRYAGCTYGLVIASQLIEALSFRAGDMANVFAGVSTAVFAFSFVAYPVFCGLRRLSSR